MSRRLPIMPADVAAAFEALPANVSARLKQVRQLIFETAERLEGVGPLTETLKWGEPAYLTEVTGSGSTIRLGKLRSAAKSCAIFFNCQTNLVSTFRSQFPDEFAYQGDRALLLSLSGPLPAAPLASCLALALTYHQKKARKPPPLKRRVASARR